MKTIFEKYGELEYMRPERFYSDDIKAEIVENCRDEDSELWTIILVSDEIGQRYVFSDL